MIGVAKSFVESWAPKSSKIGIVDFDGDAVILAYLTDIDTKSNREYLTQKLEQLDASGGTNIDAGIEKGIEVSG